MAGKLNIIKVFIDGSVEGLERELTKARTALDGFKAKVDQAEGPGGKLKAGWSAMADTLKANLGPALLTAGTAIVAFGVKASMTFTQTAIDAENLATTMGSTTEHASGLLAIMKPFGVEIGDISDIMNNLAQLIDSDDASLTRLGVTIARDSAGRVDMFGSFNNIVESLKAVQDPAERAAYAAKFFGEEGARQMISLLKSGTSVEEMFEKLSDAQIIDSEEVAKAKKFRETMDDVKASLQGLTLRAGEAFVGVVDFLDGATGAAERAGRSLRGVFDQDSAEQWKVVDEFEASESAARDFDRTLLAHATTVAQVRQIVLDHGESMHTANLVAIEWKKSTEEGTEASEAAAEAIEAQTKETLDAFQAEMKRLESIEAVAEAQRNAAGDINNRSAAEVNLAQSVDDLNAKQAETRDILDDSTLSADEHEAALRDLSGEMTGAAAEAYALSLMYAEEAAKGGTAAEKAQAQIDELQRLKEKYPEIAAMIDEYIAKLGEIPGVVTTTLDPRPGEYGYERKAGGGPVRKGETYVVGEDGEELFTAAADGEITPHNRTRALLDKFRTKATTWLAGGSASSAGPVDDESEIMGNRYEVGDIDLATYRTYLQGKLASYRMYTSEWMAEWRKLNKLAKEEADAAADAADTTRRAAEAATKAADDAARETDRLAREAETRRKDAEAAERARVDLAYEQAEAQQELAEAVAGADSAWQAMQDNAVSDPGNWAALQAGLNDKFAKALFRRADAAANAAGIDDGTVEWARAVRAALLGDKANAPGLAPWIDAILAGIPQLAGGGIVRARRGGTLVNVGEGGVDELVTPLDGRSVGNTTVNVMLPPGLSPRAIAQALRDYERYDRR